MSTTTTETRSLGAGGRQLSAVGVGTWALGGPFTFDGRYAGWGEVDDAESIRALHTAIDAGVTLIDTAPTYGTGHSERIVGQALAALPVTVRESVAVATKFGLRIDESRRTGGGNDVRPQAIRAECEASLRRLGLDAVDLYQLHGGAETVAAAEDVVATCEELLGEGKIRSFGTAQDDAETLAVFARSNGCVAVQTQVNVSAGLRPRLTPHTPTGWPCWPGRRWPWACCPASTTPPTGPRPATSAWIRPTGTTSTPTQWRAGCTALPPYGSC
jgi:aryl-alcohol dehydrogenase-like predicted oxidoreductase